MKVSVTQKNFTFNCVVSRDERRTQPKTGLTFLTSLRAVNIHYHNFSRVAFASRHKIFVYFFLQFDSFIQFQLKMGDNFGIHRTPARSVTTTEERTQGQILSDFLVQLEDYTPTVRKTLKKKFLSFSS